jgi:DNA-binding PadR family transcriptional regulator
VDTFHIRPAVEEPILQEFALCRFLTITQVQDRFFAQGSYTYASSILKQLKAHGYLVTLPSTVGEKLIYELGKKGVQYLRTAGMSITYYPSEHKTVSSIHMPHLFTTNEVLIAMAKVPARKPHIQVAERRHYLTTKQKNRSAIPDAWVHLIEDGKHHFGLWCEVDRGTEEEAYIKQKVSTILVFAETSYEEEFEIPALLICFVTTRGKHRLGKLVQWTEKALEETGKIHYQEFFRFALIPEGSLDPLWLLYEPIWCMPFHPNTVPLV